jgi:hypothetical protein
MVSTLLRNTIVLPMLCKYSVQNDTSWATVNSDLENIGSAVCKVGSAQNYSVANFI